MKQELNKIMELVTLSAKTKTLDSCIEYQKQYYLELRSNGIITPIQYDELTDNLINQNIEILNQK